MTDVVCELCGHLFELSKSLEHPYPCHLCSKECVLRLCRMTDIERGLENSGFFDKVSEEAKVKIENYKALKALLGMYEGLLENLKEWNEDIISNNVHSEPFARFHLDQGYERKKWLEQEIDRLCNE